MKFIIYQSIKGNFFADVLPKEQYQKVAEVEGLDLDDVYNKTQNISSSWTNCSDVSTNLSECRSTSVGDIIYNVEEEQSYIVSNIGFEMIDLFK